MPRFDAFARAIGERLERGGGVPLLAFRLPEFEHIAWRDGCRAARTAERSAWNALSNSGVLRTGDAFAHRPGSDRFAIAMLSPQRAGSAPAEPHVRAALDRVAAATAYSSRRRVQAGWWTVRRREEIDALGATIDAALERGLRERQRREMLASLGHELRSPIAAIGGYLDTLLDGRLDATTARRFLQTVQREALRLGRMADDLVAVSLLDVSAPPSDAHCDVAAQVRAAEQAVAPLAVRRGIALRSTLQTPATACIGADECAHALRNLLDNALKWTSPGGRIELHCRLDSDAVCVVVDDDGPGVASSERERIFELGAHGDGTGSGIGLAIVRAIARRCGGDTVASASPLGGARFELRLPAANDMPTAPRSERRDQMVSGTNRFHAKIGRQLLHDE